MTTYTNLHFLHAACHNFLSSTTSFWHTAPLKICHQTFRPEPMKNAKQASFSGHPRLLSLNMLPICLCYASLCIMIATFSTCNFCICAALYASTGPTWPWDLACWSCKPEPCCAGCCRCVDGPAAATGAAACCNTGICWLESAAAGLLLAPGVR